MYVSMECFRVYVVSSLMIRDRRHSVGYLELRRSCAALTKIHSASSVRSLDMLVLCISSYGACDALETVSTSSKASNAGVRHKVSVASLS
jgi:hypothetical protein